MPLAQINDITLYYELAGPAQGEPLVFLSGLTGDHNNWQLQVQSFQGQYRCLTFDWRDTGQSGASSSADYGLSEMAADVAGLIGVLKLGRCHLIGLSMGGAVAQLVALEHPASVASLTLASSFAVAPPPLPIPASKRTPGHLRQQAAVQSHNTLVRLETLRVPVLVIAGSRDRATPPEPQREYAARIPQARFVLIEGAGHLVQVEKAGEFNRQLRTFLTDNTPVE